MKQLLKLAAAFAGLVSTAAMATPVYNYSIDNPAGSAGAGDITNVTTSYDDDNSLFTWESTVEDKNGGFADGFWLVISDGPNPKNDGGEYAIMCGDLDTGRLNMFVYNGQNANNSCNAGATGLLQSEGMGFIDVVDSGSLRTFSFTLDVTSINDAFNTSDWDGVFFDDTIGIWFHTSINSSFSYDANGMLTNYSHGSQSYYDTSNRTTTPVPTPAPLLLMVFALPLLLRRNK